jgi:large subunit ribosomal protein L2
MLFFRTFTQTCFYENSFYTNSFFLKKLLGSVYKLDNFNQNDACFNIIPLRSKTGKFAKAAGTYCKILYKSVDLNFYFLKLPSGLTRKFSKLCIATFGRNMNKLHKKCIRGSAGRSLQFGFRSAVRGVAMNPVDHPHGGRTKTSQPEISP